MSRGVLKHSERHVQLARGCLFAVTLALALLSSCGSADKDPVPNVRLGMAPRDVRERFQPGEPGQPTPEGSWQTALGAGDDTALEWTSKEARSRFAGARFEFHLGMLVAIRAELRVPSSKESISTTAKTVTLLAPKDGGTTVTVLSRDCPTHKDEAESIATRAR